MKARTISTLTGALGACLLLATGARADTRCVSPSGFAPAGEVCLRTVQAAVDAATPGTLIQVFPGVYYEDVIVPSGKDGIQIVGQGRDAVVVDPSPFADRGITDTSSVGFDVRSAGVQLRTLTIRNGFLGVRLQGAEAVVDGLRITGADSGITVTEAAPDAQILSNEIVATASTGIAISGTFSRGMVVRSNVILGVGTGIRTAQAQADQIVGNRIERTRGPAIEILAGQDTAVRTNTIRQAAGSAIHVIGERPAVERNQIAGAGSGVVVQCVSAGPPDTTTPCTVAENTVADTAEHGLSVAASASGPVVRANRLTRTGRGLRLEGSGLTAVQNQVSDVGRDLDGHCFEVVGSAHRLIGNVAARCSNAGFYVNGGGVRLEQNQALGTFENGFTVDGRAGPGATFADTVLLGNLARADAAQGIAIINGARNTVVTGNTATDNRTDFCDEGFGTRLANNTFGTIGPCAVLH